MYKLELCDKDTQYIQSMKSYGYEYFLFDGESNIFRNDSKIQTFRSKESAEEAAIVELKNKQRLYKVARISFIKGEKVFISEIHEVKFKTFSLSSFFWQQPNEEMWGTVREDGSLYLDQDGLPKLTSKELALNSDVGIGAVKFGHYLANGKPVVVERIIFERN